MVGEAGVLEGEGVGGLSSGWTIRSIAAANKTLIITIDRANPMADSMGANASQVVVSTGPTTLRTARANR